MSDVIIVGGGASGLIASVMAARAGARVTVLEQNDKPGKKLSATGNGKCNLTNLSQTPEDYRGTDPDFSSFARKDFSVSDTLDFFTELGLCPVNKNNYIYPRSGQASSVTELLCMEAARLGVKIKTKEKATELHQKKGKWTVLTKTWHYEADAVILSGGSSASAISGSDGSCYQLAAALGHKIIKPLPALTAFKCSGSYFSGWAGVRTQANVTLLIDGNPRHSAEGEVQLTEYGISGIPVFQVSRYGIRSLYNKEKVSLSIDFLPEIQSSDLDRFWEDRKKRCPLKNEKELLIGLFPEKLNKVICNYSKKRHIELPCLLKRFPLEVCGYLPYEQAQVCSGGVDTSEIDPHTMESRLCPGLYFAGELMDVDGTCGGYNLQWAWSSGACAGLHSAGVTGSSYKQGENI